LSYDLNFCIKLYDGQVVEVELPVTFAGGNSVKWPTANEIEFAVNDCKLEKQTVAHLVQIEYGSAQVYPLIWMTHPDGYNPIRSLRLTALQGSTCKVTVYIRGRAETLVITALHGPASIPDWLEEGLLPE